MASKYRYRLLSRSPLRGRRRPPEKRLIGRLCNSTIGESETCLLCPMPSFPPCLNRGIDGILPDGGGRAGTGLPQGVLELRRLGKPARFGEILAIRDNARGDGQWGKFDWP